MLFVLAFHFVLTHRLLHWWSTEPLNISNICSETLMTWFHFICILAKCTFYPRTAHPIGAMCFHTVDMISGWYKLFSSYHEDRIKISLYIQLVFQGQLKNSNLSNLCSLQFLCKFQNINIEKHWYCMYNPVWISQRMFIFPYTTQTPLFYKIFHYICTKRKYHPTSRNVLRMHLSTRPLLKTPCF